MLPGCWFLPVGCLNLVQKLLVFVPGGLIHSLTGIGSLDAGAAQRCTKLDEGRGCFDASHTHTHAHALQGHLLHIRCSTDTCTDVRKHIWKWRDRPVRLSFSKNIYLYIIWLRQVLAAARGIFVAACGTFVRHENS